MLLFLCFWTSNVAANLPPYIVVIVADWGMQKNWHDKLLPQLDASYTLALHVLGDRMVATGQHELLLQVPTLQELQQAERYLEGCPDGTRKHVQGVWIENNDGESAYPKPAISPYLVFSQPPLHPNPPAPNENTVIGHFWVPTKLPLPERQKIYDMAASYAKKAGGCVLSITLTTEETWSHFHQWVQSLKGGTRFVSLAEYVRLSSKAKP